MRPLPASEQLLVLFVADLSQRVSYSTIRTYLAGIRHLHISEGVGNPLNGKLKLDLLLRGVKRSKPTRPNSRLPVTPMILRLIRKVLTENPNDEDNIMFWAACCLGFSAFLRSGEFTVKSAQSFDPQWDLTPRDIAVDSIERPTRMYVTIKGSKTDQTRQGITLVVGRTGNDLCPLAAMLPYLVLRGNELGPLFRWKNQKGLAREELVSKLRQVLRRAGVECSRYSGHSFRIGAATTAAARGVSDSTIQTLGRWASDAFTRYIRIPRDNLAEISSLINR